MDRRLPPVRHARLKRKGTRPEMWPLVKMFDLPSVWPPVWPPVWLALFCGLVWLCGGAGITLFGGAGDVAAGGLLVAASILFGLALREMAAARTTVLPHRIPARLVTSGIFRLTRNPIYLADTALLSALVLWRDVPLALPLVPLFMLVIRERFIRAEEAVLRDLFALDFAHWSQRVRRWL